ncbi:MAG: hypothetical protein GEU80_14180 [Dehalococcoidia bacterium]|nr:hypothetical protein [Dehalococcoidia bacterium]
MSLWQRFWSLRWRVKGPVIVVVALVLLSLVPASEDDDAPEVAPPASTATEVGAEIAATNTSPPTSTASVATQTATPTAEAEAKPASWDDGTHRVGSDIAPGLYVSQAGDFCYWTRLSGFGGTLGEIISNQIGAGGQELVQIADTDIGFETTGCADWTLVNEASLTPPPAVDDGVYLVGTQIAPGTWAAPGSDTCYWARLSGFGGDLGEIVANHAGPGAQVATIGATDAGFRSSGCGEWTQ